MPVLLLIIIPDKYFGGLTTRTIITHILAMDHGIIRIIMGLASLVCGPQEASVAT